MITSLRILGLLIAVVLPFEALCLWMSFFRSRRRWHASFRSHSLFEDAPRPCSIRTNGIHRAAALRLLVLAGDADECTVSFGADHRHIPRRNGMGGVRRCHAEVVRRYALMNGGREPTISMWLANLTLIFTITGAIAYTWRRDGEDRKNGSRRRHPTRRSRHTVHLGLGVSRTPRRLMQAGDRIPGEVIGLDHPTSHRPWLVFRPAARVSTLHSSPLQPVCAHTRLPFIPLSASPPSARTAPRACHR
jgi:hypothetical protein